MEHFGWRSIFFVVVPFCLAAFAMGRRYLPHTSPGADSVNAFDRRFDLPGLVLLAIAVVSGMNGLVHLHTPSMHAYGLLAVSVATAAAFIWRQRHARHPLMDFKLFDIRAFRMGACVAFIYGMALFGSTYLVPVFMQEALHLPPSQAGAVLLPAGLALAATIPIAGRFADRVAVGKMVMAGLGLLAASFYLMLGVGLATSLLLIMTWTVIGRIGLGIIMPSLNLGAMVGLPHGLISHGSSTINFLRQLGGAVGIGLVGNVLEWRLRTHATAPIVAYHETFALVGTITAAAIVAAWRMTPTRHAVAQSARIS